MVFDGADTDIDLQLLDSSGGGAGCLYRNDKEITATLQPGTYYLVLDTYVAGGAEQVGEYLLVLM